MRKMRKQRESQFGLWKKRLILELRSICRLFDFSCQMNRSYFGRTWNQQKIKLTNILKQNFSESSINTAHCYFVLNIYENTLLRYLFTQYELYATRNLFRISYSKYANSIGYRLGMAKIQNIFDAAAKLLPRPVVPLDRKKIHRTLLMSKFILNKYLD